MTGIMKGFQYFVMELTYGGNLQQHQIEEPVTLRTHTNAQDYVRSLQRTYHDRRFVICEVRQVTRWVPPADEGKVELSLIPEEPL